MDGISTPPSPFASPALAACRRHTWADLEILEIPGACAGAGAAPAGDDASAGDAVHTTVMLQNIPNKFTRKMLVDQLHVAGFKGDVDYLYLPTDFKNRCNMGYCFLNFRTDAARRSFTEAFHGVAVQACLPGFNSQKVCRVARAKLQGREENLRRLRASADLMAQLIYEPEWLPLLFDVAGNELPFPREDGQPHQHHGGVPPPRRHTSWSMSCRGGNHNHSWQQQRHQQHQQQQQQQQQQQGWRGLTFPPAATGPPSVLGLTVYRSPVADLDAGCPASAARCGGMPMMIGLPIIQNGLYTAHDPMMPGTQCSIFPMMVACSPASQ